MTESVTENGGFTQDLFSPLQFCEVVEEGQQHNQQQQSLQQLHPHQAAQLSQTQLNLQQSPHHQHQHNPSPPHIQNHHHHHHHQQQQQQQHQQQQQQSIKQEIQQPLQSRILSNTTSDSKPQPLITSVSSMEIFLTSNPVQLQGVGTPVVAIHQQQSQPIYQVQLTRQQHQTLQQIQVNPLRLQPQSQAQNIHISQNHSQLQQTQPPLPSSPSSVTVGTIVTMGAGEPYVLPMAAQPKVPSTNAVATQTTPSDRGHLSQEDDEPEIIFTNVSNTAAEPSLIMTQRNNEIINKPVKHVNEATSPICNGNSEAKPIPIKRTWRRPWKKKKDREKKQPAKKVRRIKRRRIMVPKKNVIHVDPRHGPPIDTSNTVVARESEDTIDQLKQKRQRIKLNRNSGREYINRLGKTVRARKIGSPCNCPLKCWDRMGSKILDIFNNFWDLCDFNLQNSYLFTCLKLCDVKRRYTKKQPAEESRRQNTFEYFVRISGKHLRVCKKAFMSAHGLTSDKRLRTLFSQMKDGALVPEPDKRGKHLRPSKSQSNGHHLLPHNSNNNNQHSSHFNNNTNPPSKVSNKQKNKYKKKQQSTHRMDASKQAMYTPPSHTVSHLHPHCTPPPPPAHGTSMQEPPHAYIPNGEIYFPGHYLEPPQAMAPHHMNQIPCQKMLETPAYFMAGMKENTFHQ